MRGSDKDLDALGPLLTEGRFDEARSLMLQLWPPDAPLDRSDVEILTMALRGSNRLHGEKARTSIDPLTSA